jgi:uncharacterized protein with HEPN domain
MPSSNPYRRLNDILVNIALAKQFVENLSFEEFKNDTKTIYAVIRCLEIISEASRRIPEDIQAKYPDIPWQDIKGVGNIYRHDYDNVSTNLVWKTVNNALTPLENMARTELNICSIDPN